MKTQDRWNETQLKTDLNAYGATDVTGNKGCHVLSEFQIIVRMWVEKFIFKL